MIHESLKHPTISQVMIIKSKKEFLGDCLASVIDVYGELIIADTDSTDSTLLRSLTGSA